MGAMLRRLKAGIEAAYKEVEAAIWVSRVKVVWDWWVFCGWI